jgi:hypothetical protein
MIWEDEMHHFCCMDLWQVVGVVRVKGFGAVWVERLLDFSVSDLSKVCIGGASSNIGTAFWCFG